ncbi:MAG: ABC transporter [Deltaproteobacteria bacterium RIFCSPLOWO2_12_FULL_40_28]|nr:MAG: ABC transporter [Deltaproteobacteria bacterium RIFCSPHIGHO2_02_FULL_40_28]OGQ20015.1 MAG: ABC transporter [Deltaproteobacteria bacterium RIFCSPHIGHO2_12_FULL_40_32]OGQ40582.1 MAG: ABC transporter [Deltaproteobacteria bacterium RIFCSPLOWO2_02_FULL_40_36]OGQ54251.1 MAG: ABC transporter [Deltaproteobacteria bacterium RIFCSPLOWO2_12_FULL_40_28]
MKNIFTITKKEFLETFFSPLAYVFLVVFVVLVYWFFFSDLFLLNQASLRGVFNWVPLIFLVFLPAITMGKWSEEKKSGTLEILLTLPVKDFEIVLGKFLSSFLFLLVALFLTTPLVGLVALLGDLDGGAIWGGYLGLIFLGAASLAIGLFISSLTESAIIAFIISFLILFGLLLIGESVVLSFLPKLFASFLSSLSLSQHFQSIARGVIDSRDVLYYLSLAGYFLFLNVLSLESRKWKN